MGKTVLLDENLPQPLRLRLTGHEVMTVGYKGWSGKSNRDLVALADADGFDVMLTADQNLSYQQNMKGRRIALVVLNTNDKSVLLANVQRIAFAIDEVPVGGYVFLEIGVRT